MGARPPVLSGHVKEEVVVVEEEVQVGDVRKQILRGLEDYIGEGEAGGGGGGGDDQRVS